ncbi:Pepsin A [Phytophthora cinnamomi]|uniref:Pepsin A n=1 Tax=Phytophthora cinnamomi TaxID=4785 RepID=UPI00355939E4|nr:Pepsin A [Phytophthora cinnamomi]
MTPNQYEDKEVHTPAGTPAVQGAHYHDETALRLDVTTPEAENKKDDEDIPLDKNGRPMVKLFRWRMSRRKRWCIIIGLVLLFLVVALLIVYLVVIPAIIRHYMDKVVLKINYMDVTSIPSDTEIDVIFSVNLQHDVPVSATTDPVTASLIYDGVMFGTAGVVGQHIKSGKQNYNLTMNTTMVISDVDTFNAMSEAMMQEATVPITMSAKIDAHAWGLPFNNIKFERTLSLVGFDNFVELDPDVQHIDLWGCSDGVYEMDVNASINNPSAMGLQGIGALNMSVYYNNSYLGYAYSEKPELGMPRGLSNQSFRVVMFEDSPALEGVITGFLGAGGVTVNVRGDNPYSTEYTQFKEAMSKVNMSVEYNDGLDKVSFNTSCVSSFLAVLGY